MNIEELREYCLSLPHVKEDMPFDEETLVFKIGGRMFCFASLEGDLKMNLKCDPDEAIEIRETFASVTPGFHMNKRHWNTVLVDGTVSDSLLKVWISNSYKLVITQLTKAVKAELGL